MVSEVQVDDPDIAAQLLNESSRSTASSRSINVSRASRSQASRGPNSRGPNSRGPASRGPNSRGPNSRGPSRGDPAHPEGTRQDHVRQNGHGPPREQGKNNQYETSRLTVNGLFIIV